MRVDHALELRRRLCDPIDLVRRLGLEEGAKRQARGLMVRCPVHAERTPSCSIRQAEDGTVAAKCHGCNWSGDALSLVAVVRGLDPHRDFPRVIQEAAALCGYVVDDSKPAPPPVAWKPLALPPRQRPPVTEVEAIWVASSSVAEATADVALFLLRRRLSLPDLSKLDLVRVAPLKYAWPSWWPETWAKSWRIVTRAYEADGKLASLHARAIDDASPKTRWPFNCRADGLIFGDAAGVALLRGDARAFDRVLVVEGLTDMIAASLWAVGRRVAVISVTSGSSAALMHVRWPSGVPVVVATDHDDAGNRYAAAVEAAVPKRISVARWRAA